MLRFLSLIFTWWNGATVGTLWTVARQGALVGEDEQGNRYYEQRRPHAGRMKRRWVIYNGVAEASRIPPDWHGWLHHTVDAPPTETPLPRKPWEKDHRPNMTGTPDAYRPSGSLHRAAERPKATGDYEPWNPDAEKTAAP